MKATRDFKILRDIDTSEDQLRLIRSDDNFHSNPLMKIKDKIYYKETDKKLSKHGIKEKKRNKSHTECLDPIERYNTVPLHAVFLYSSQHEHIEDYIKKNWGALSSMSKDDCDIYFPTDQLDHEFDAFDAIDQLCAKVDISKLPGMLFWENKISNNCFLSFKDLNEENITNLLLTVFDQIRKSQTIDSITEGEVLFRNEQNKKTLHSSSSGVNLNFSGPVNGTIVGYVQGDFITGNKRTLNNIFESLEWNEEKKRQIEELEKNIKDNESALEEVQLFINKLVEANATNKSFTSKLKDFAFSISTGISSSLIASAIFASLTGLKI